MNHGNPVAQGIREKTLRSRGSGKERKNPTLPWLREGEKKPYA